MSSPRDTRVCRQETVIAVFQGIRAFILASVTSTPRSGSLVRMLLPLCAGGMVTGSCQKAWRKHGATSLWRHGSLPLHLCILSVCVPDTGLLFCPSGDPQPIHATHFLARGETLLTHVFLCARCVVWMFLITACLGWREANGPAVVSAEGHYPRLRLG